MAKDGPLQGELQLQVMATVWKLGEGTVEQVRGALPKRSRGAYTTVQTVLNRLAERGLLERSKRANQVVYSPAITEAEYLSRTIESTLASASSEARQVALANLLGGLDRAELADVREHARRIERERKR